MKSTMQNFAIAAAIATATISCDMSKKEATSTHELTEKIEVEQPITLTQAPPSIEFPDALLSKKDVKITKQDTSYLVDYSFDVQNFELGSQTTGAANRGIANSDKGQHIHFIVNDGPYSAHYVPGAADSLKAGNYVVLAFLSRSYHESVKDENAYHVENLKVGDVETEAVDLDAPHLFYSRPKGTYSGTDTKKLMLDFYLINTELSPTGNKVKATINGAEFMIDQWAPYYIEGLDKGEVTISLELIDATGQKIEGPFNSVTRTVTLK
ncbi:phosphopeptide-binding protein [Reichenbachiella agarivorans]|uniref:Phosphopeptide-binding protein n=1 Tax=Reichenbachiella agarivorans TaxID=2979464 RepID=A0ABY6CPM1_9BACT|nr:phosphopeptide-binding protein [Reichenbachiella agarivorans]UXP32314.1 phosphopeptide-binding protein [Reichenbachiella agarivorans]